jgi:hypothetical protein
MRAATDGLASQVPGAVRRCEPRSQQGVAGTRQPIIKPKQMSESQLQSLAVSHASETTLIKERGGFSPWRRPWLGEARPDQRSLREIDGRAGCGFLSWGRDEAAGCRYTPCPSKHLRWRS